MATISSDVFGNNRTLLTPLGNEVTAQEGKASVGTGLAQNDLVKLCLLPAGCVPVDFYLTATDLDTHVSPTITISVSVLNDAGDDLLASTEFLVDSTVAQAGGVARADKVNGLRLAPSTSDRVIVAKITNAGATKAAGTLTGVLQFRWSHFD